MDPCRTGMDRPNLAIFLFSQSLESRRWQHLIDAVENGPLGSERGVSLHSFHPVWMRHCNLVRQPFPLHLTKGPRTFLILRRSSQVRRGYTHTEGTSKPARAHICSEILTTEMASSVGGGFPMGGPSRPMVQLLRLSEGSLKIMSDI